MEKQFPYRDILYLERPKSKHHAPMPLLERGAQFAPFAALHGHGAVLAEAAEIPALPIHLAPDRDMQLDEKLRELSERIAGKPYAVFTVYQFDRLRSRGEFRETAGFVRRIDITQQKIYFTDGTALLIPDIVDIRMDETP